MALFKNTYSGLITGGLGGAACCGMITMGFHLFRCTIEVIPPPRPGGGGGGKYHVNYHTPRQYSPKLKDHNIRITVQFKDGNKWSTMYRVSKKRADLIVKVTNIVNIIKDKINVGVDSFKRVTKTITTNFKNNDK